MCWYQTSCNNDTYITQSHETKHWEKRAHTCRPHLGTLPTPVLLFQVTMLYHHNYIDCIVNYEAHLGLAGVIRDSRVVGSHTDAYPVSEGNYFLKKLSMVMLFIGPAPFFSMGSQEIKKRWPYYFWKIAGSKGDV